jgi:predicted nucleic acid-binding protein
LASIGHFGLLHQLFGTIIIPKAVYDEAVIAGREKGGAKREITFWVLMDEKKGRRKLTQLGIKKIGTVGILLKAKEACYIKSVMQNLTKLRENGFSISQYVVDRVLQEAGEK